MKRICKKLTALLLSLLMLLSAGELTAYAALPPVTSVSAVNAYSGIKIKWKKVSGADGYRVYTFQNSRWVRLADTEKTAYTDKKVRHKRAYTYRVTPYKGSKKKLGTASKSVTKLRMATPKITGFEETGPIELRFTDFKNAYGDTYYVYRSRRKKGKYTLIARKKESFFEDYKTITGKCYYYRLRLVNGNNKSALSKPYKVQTTWESGDCALGGHKIRLVKTVKPTALLDGYKIFSCKCKYEYYAKPYKKATGVKMPSGKDYAYAEAVKRDKKSVWFLEKIRQEDQTNLLQIRTGSEEDIRFLKKVSDTLTKNCRTDAEKIKTVYDWVTANITYNSLCSSFPTDVYRDRKGDCQGMSNLCVDMLRLQKIPCASILGYRGDTKTVLTENNMDELCGVKHQWVRAYDGTRWVFFDPTFSVFDPDETAFDIPQWYYTQMTDYVGVYYKGMNLRNTLGFPYYVNGHYYGFEEDGKLNTLSSGCFLDDQNIFYQINDFDMDENGSKHGNYYKSEGYRLYEIFAGRPIYLRQTPGTDYSKLRPTWISYYNGVCVVNTTYTIKGRHYLDLRHTYTRYSGKYLASYEGHPALQSGDTIYIQDLWGEENGKRVSFSSSDPKVLKVQQTGKYTVKVTALKEGYAWVDSTDKDRHHDFGVFIYVKGANYKLKKSDLAPLEDIKIQRSKIHF